MQTFFNDTLLTMKCETFHSENVVLLCNCIVTVVLLLKIDSKCNINNHVLNHRDVFEPIGSLSFSLSDI